MKIAKLVILISLLLQLGGIKCICTGSGHRMGYSESGSSLDSIVQANMSGLLLLLKKPSKSLRTMSALTTPMWRPA